MKILITFYEINNFGGIINNQEGLYAGLKELGHEVYVRFLTWKDSVSASKTRRRLKQETGQMGLDFDLELGWQWPADSRVAYKGQDNLNKWKEFASTMDLIIWQIPVPTTQRENRGNSDWISLYDVPTKQIAYIHDGNMVARYPWIYIVSDKLTGVIGVHPCAYNSCKNLPLPRALAFSPQTNIEKRMQTADSKKQVRNGWFSLQVFKAWKHVDDIVRAVPYMGKYNKILAGGGLQMHYMCEPKKVSKWNSPETAKDGSVLPSEFIASIDRDPNLPKERAGFPIWKLAEQFGMNYVGFVTNEEREKYLHGAKYLIDPSWSRAFANIGDHFNRTVIDGIIGGAVPIARNLGVSTNSSGHGEFFHPDENYFMIPHNSTPKEFAVAVNSAMALSESKRKQVLECGRSMLHHFSYLNTAQAFVDMARGKSAGVRKDSPKNIGTLDLEMKAVGDRVLREFFEFGEKRKRLF